MTCIIHHHLDIAIVGRCNIFDVTHGCYDVAVSGIEICADVLLWYAESAFAIFGENFGVIGRKFHRCHTLVVLISDNDCKHTVVGDVALRNVEVYDIGCEFLTFVFQVVALSHLFIFFHCRERRYIQCQRSKIVLGITACRRVLLAIDNEFA